MSVRCIRACVALSGLLLVGTSVAANVSVVVDAPSSKDPAISPFIYGLGTYMREDRRDENTWDLKPPYFRFGGNLAERFNWKVNAWNSGADWYFSNVGSRHKDMVDAFLAANVAHDVQSSVALPMLGWVAKDNSSFSFPVDAYGKQRDAQHGAGNGVSLNGEVLKADPNRANIPITPAWTAEWARHLKTRFGRFPRHFIIGNEPMLWHRTHRDVHPEPATYDEVRDKYIATAAAVREADPEAVIIGPALWGWLATQQSAADERGPWNNYRKFADRDRHGGKKFLEWFLEQIAREERKRGVSLLDVLDVHYYPEGDKVRNRDPATDVSREARLLATRSLWDAEYTDDSWINDRIRMIPYLKSLADRAKPGLKVALGEYRFGADQDISGAVVQAEVLGIFGREGLWSANYWTIPPTGSSVAQAFKLYRNYDGRGASFGDRSLGNSVGIKKDYSVFSSWSEARKKTVLVLTNKSTRDPRAFEISLRGEKRDWSKARAFRVSMGDPHSVVPVDVTAMKPWTVELPAMSVLLLETD